MMFSPAKSVNTREVSNLDALLDKYWNEMWEMNIADMSDFIYKGISADIPGYQFFISADGDDKYQPQYRTDGAIQAAQECGGLMSGDGVQTCLNIVLY